jgi:hypothetical protein
MDIVGWMILAIVAVAFVKAAVALYTGRIDLGWALERVAVERAKSPFLYWFMLLGTLLLGLFGLALILAATTGEL